MHRQITGLAMLAKRLPVDLRDLGKPGQRQMRLAVKGRQYFCGNAVH
jgi:hypothetical protein